MATLAISSSDVNSASLSCRGRRFRRHQHQCLLSGTTSPNSSSQNPPDVLITPPPPSPPLLLEGDKFYISTDGKSHTVYRLERSSSESSASFHDFLLEESYDIERARKSINLFGPSLVFDENSDETENYSDTTCADLLSFDLQEINNGVSRAGTGCMTWESSVAMGLYFAFHPHELRGKVIELGSGVGLGGILSTAARNIAHGKNSNSSSDNAVFTFTDGNDEVLDMLRENMNAAMKSSMNVSLGENIRVRKLDWLDFLGGDAKDSDRYDTILASDCAYIHSQVAPLSETISKLLGNGAGQKLHMFSPHNRGVIYELIEELQDKMDMNVEVEELEMSKYRMKQSDNLPSFKTINSYDSLNGNIVHGRSKFLHVTAWHKEQSFEETRPKGQATTRMTEID